MPKISSLLLLLSLIAHFGYSQEENQITTVLLSAMSTPEQMAELIDDARENGIYLNIDHIDWNETENQIKAMDFSLQFLRQDGTKGKKSDQSLKFNELTEGIIVLLQRGEKHPVHLVANNRHLFFEMQDLLIGDVGKNNKIFTNFSESFTAQDENRLSSTALKLQTYFHSNNELIAQIRRERDPGSKSSMYRYYYNGKRLNGSFGINETDMTCDASLRKDDDGKLSLFVTSDIALSPFAAIEE